VKNVIDTVIEMLLSLCRPSILLAMLPVQEQVAKTIQYELDPVERLPELAAALNHYLSNVLKCISLSHIDVKTRVAVAIKHLSCFEKALSDSETSVPGGIKLYVSVITVVLWSARFGVTDIIISSR
jgi:hypothetical protein